MNSIELVPFELKNSPIYFGTGQTREWVCNMDHSGYWVYTEVSKISVNLKKRNWLWT